MSPTERPAAGNAGVHGNLDPLMAVAAEGIDLSIANRTRICSDCCTRRCSIIRCCRRIRVVRILGITAFLAAVSMFGEPRVRPWIPHVEGFPAVTTLSSEDRDTEGDGERLVAGATWHSDDSFMAAPSALTALHGVVVPETGGDTEFANLHAAYEALSDAMKQRLDGMRAVHVMKAARDGVGRTRSIAADVQAKQVPSTHPVIRTHPETGRKSLYISRNRMDLHRRHGSRRGHRLIDELVRPMPDPPRR